jgi:hypothetical protein
MVTTPGTNPISDRLTQRHLPSDEAASGMAFAYPDCPSANTNAVPHDVTGRDKGRCGIELSPLCAECGRLLLSHIVVRAMLPIAATKCYQAADTVHR